MHLLREKKTNKIFTLVDGLKTDDKEVGGIYGKLCFHVKERGKV